MYRFREGETTMKKKNKTKHEQSEKHNYFSNLVLNKLIIKDIAVDNLYTIYNPIL